MGELGDYLRELRLALGWTLRDVEDLSGDISNAHLSQIENGRIERPSEAMLHDLALLYGVEYTELATRAGFVEKDEERSDISRRAVIDAALRAYDNEDPAEHQELLRDLEQRALRARERRLKARRNEVGDD